MPNWCENTLTVSGHPELVVEFQEFAKSEDGGLMDFDRFVPYPEKYRAQDREVARLKKELQAMPEPARKLYLRLNGGYPKDGYNSGGYGWRITNWGTKWNAKACGHVQSARPDDGRIVYRFDTAWSPPRPVTLIMSRLFPDLRFVLQYRLPDMGSEGEYEFTGGKTSKIGRCGSIPAPFRKE